MQVGVAVIEQRGRYLISRRRPQDHLGGFWEFPGGKRRVGESWPACLRRELREELGVGVAAGERLMSLRYRYPNRQVVLAIFRCRVTSGRPKPLACQEIRWISSRQLARFKFPPADRALIRWLTQQRQLSRAPQA